jgi:ATP-dependent Clp protease adaptor protein ClpS
MSKKEKIQDRPVIEEITDRTGIHYLILYNDEINTFDFVIESLVDVCFMNTVQAEQCALIAHYKGKCDVKKGALINLKPMKDELNNRGLNVVIC